MVPPLGMTPSEFHNRVLYGKTTMTELPGDEKSLIVSLAVSIHYTNVTDGRTDRQTDVYGHLSTAKTALCIASRGNNARNIITDLTSIITSRFPLPELTARVNGPS